MESCRQTPGEWQLHRSCQRLANGDPATCASMRAIRYRLKRIFPGELANVPLTRQDSRGFETHRAHRVTCSFARLCVVGPPTQNQRSWRVPAG